MAAIVSTIFLGGCSFFGIRSGTEEPSYTVVDTLGDAIEVRRYSPRLAAEVVVEGDEEASRSEGFRTLAAYIFGENRSGPKIDMTAPVAQEAAEEIPMTAPVAQTDAGGGRWRIRFFMPSAYDRESLPAPTDPKVEIVEVPEEMLAVIRFSGSRAPAAVHDAADRLKASLRDSGWQVVGDWRAYFYDPPWTIPFLRRNEVAIPVESADSSRMR